MPLEASVRSDGIDDDELAADCDKSRVIVTSQTAFGGNLQILAGLDRDSYDT